MKSKKIVCLLLVFLIIILTINISSYAVTLPELTISSNDYSAGEKMNDDDKKDVDVGKTLQLYAVTAFANDMIINNNIDSLGQIIKETNLSGVTWTSSDTDIATVDNTGKVTGVAEGKATITASYNNENATYEINVNATSEEDDASIAFGFDIPEPARILNEDGIFDIYLYNIPETEKGNIKVTIEDEKIAKITEIFGLEDDSKSIMVNVKFLKLGQTKITATLDYNGKTYSDTCEFSVVESEYFLEILSEEYTELPSSLEAGNKVQLTVSKCVYGAKLPRNDITTKGVTYTSSNEKVAKVDDKGLVTAIGEGTATITAKYKVEEDGKTISAKYELKVTDPTKSSVNPGDSSSSDSSTTNGDPTTSPTQLPQTGEIIAITVIGIILIFLISIIMYKKHKNLKDIK